MPVSCSRLNAVLDSNLPLVNFPPVPLPVRLWNIFPKDLHNILNKEYLCYIGLLKLKMQLYLNLVLIQFLNTHFQMSGTFFGRRNLSDTEVVRHGSSPTKSGVVRLGFVGQLPASHIFVTSLKYFFLDLGINRR